MASGFFFTSLRIKQSELEPDLLERLSTILKALYLQAILLTV